MPERPDDASGSGVVRRLSAILSMDVQGYSRLMGDDEEATIRTLTTYRRVLGTMIDEQRGRVVDSPGDNLLAEFPSVVDAVRCAVQAQDELAERNAELPELRKMRFRIGINVGDVIAEGERIYGDGVNIAARIEALASGGAVCVSGSVREQIEGKLNFEFRDLGAQTLKNIARPIQVYEIVTSASIQASSTSPAITSTVTTAPADDRPSIAVLPFLNHSRDPEHEFFSDGMTEDLITDLSKISGLFVISRNSVFTYKGESVRPEQVCKDLGVRYVLEGSVRRAANRVRITAQLLDATTDYHLWAERYDRQLDDIFAVQGEVIHCIVQALAVQLTAGEQARVGAAPTQSIEAYDAFVRGREEYARREKNANFQARTLFEKALELDPGYAEACAFLGRTYLTEMINQWGDGPACIEKTFEYGQQAVALDPTQPTAHETLAYAFLARREHDEAIAAAREAITFDPNFSDAYITLGEVLCFAGQPEEAVPLIEHAMRLNPKYPPNYLWSHGHGQKLLGDFESAVATFKRVVTRNPDHFVSYLMLCVCYAEMGQFEQARAAAQEILRVSPDYSVAVGVARSPYRDKAIIDRQFDLLRQVGLT